MAGAVERTIAARLTLYTIHACLEPDFSSTQITLKWKAQLS